MRRQQRRRRRPRSGCDGCCCEKRQSNSYCSDDVSSCRTGRSRLCWSVAAALLLLGVGTLTSMQQISSVLVTALVVPASSASNKRAKIRRSRSAATAKVPSKPIVDGGGAKSDKNNVASSRPDFTDEVTSTVSDDGKDEASSRPDFTDEVRTLALSRYNTDDNNSLLRKNNKSKTRLPPWLARHDDNDDDDDDEGSETTRGKTSGGGKYSLGLLTTRTGNEPATVAQNNMDRLRSALLRHHTYLGTCDRSIDASSSCSFTDDDVKDIMDALRVASRGDWSLMAGAAEFLWLLLSVEENQFMSSSLGVEDVGEEAVIDLKPQELFGSDDDDDAEEDIEIRRMNSSKCEKRSFNIFTRDTLIASAFHYADCVEARRSGVYGMVSQAVRGVKSTSSFADEWRRQLLPSAEYAPEADDNGVVEIADDDNSDFKPIDGLDDGTVSDPDWAVTAKLSGPTISDDLSNGSIVEGVSQFGENAARIAQATARIKRTEILADTVAFSKATNPTLGNGEGVHVKGPSSATPTKSEADTLRGLLISVSEDWRALAIRSVACLYRLRGIIRFGGGERTPEVVKAAREAVHVYAPLAQRLGMHRLKADLEELAFGLLYERQYAAAAVLYDQNGNMMNDVEDYATTIVEEALREDSMLMEQIDSIKVTSRVKQPYSLWKKLLKQRTKMANAGKDMKELSVQNVNDAIALRVILRARKLSPTEDAESVRTREALLCYYVQRLIFKRFPATDVLRMKDYISNPKPNGYQSLHYTANIFRHGIDWPFEVQVRSEEMHRLAEYGVAAHWDYKLQEPMGLKGVTPTPPSSRKELDSAQVIADKLKEKTSDLSKEKDSSPSASNDERDEEVTVANKRGVVIEYVDPADEDDERDSILSSYIDALTTAREEIKANKVFVFVSTTNSALDGKILPLSAGATVADALNEADARYGIDLLPSEGDEAELLCNGQAIGLDDELGNGDVVVVNSDAIAPLTVDSV